MTVPELHAIVVAYGDPPLLDRCLERISPELPVTIVDNSGAATVAAVAERCGAAYVDSGRNRGFAGGVNLGLTQLARTPVDVLLLNPDVEIDVATIHALHAFLRAPANSRLAAVTPRLVDEAGREQRVLWPFPSPARAWLQAVGLGRLPTRRSFAVGAALLLRREAIDAVGRFDERFFLYAEEADWQRRAVNAGWQTAVCPQAQAMHLGAATSKDPLRRETLFHAAQEVYVRKWYGSAGWHLYRLGTIAGAAARAVLLRGERRAEAARRTSLYRRGPMRTAGLLGD